MWRDRLVWLAPSRWPGNIASRLQPDIFRDGARRLRAAANIARTLPAPGRPVPGPDPPLLAPSGPIALRDLISADVSQSGHNGRVTSAKGWKQGTPLCAPS